MKKTAQKVETKKSVVLRFVKTWSVPLSTSLVVLILVITAFIISRQTSSSNNLTGSPSAELILSADNISLPTPDYRSGNSVEAVLKNRRTRLDFTDAGLSLKQISQLLWAAQGVNVEWGDRTAPSAKSTYPLTVFLIANKVSGLDPGEYQYIPGDRTMVHQLKPIKKAEIGQALFDLLNQSSFNNIPAIFVITGNMSKMAEAYGGIPHDKEVFLEAGYVAQNVTLETESLKLGTNVSTNFDELKLKELITVSGTDTIILLMPIGVPK